MDAQACPTGIIKVYLHHNSSVPHHLRSLYLHLHQACLLGHHLLRLDTAVPKAFCLQVSNPLSKASLPRVLRRLRGLVLLPECLPECLPDCLPDCSQGLEELGSGESLEEHHSNQKTSEQRTREKLLVAVTT